MKLTFYNFCNVMGKYVKTKITFWESSFSRGSMLLPYRKVFFPKVMTDNFLALGLVASKPSFIFKKQHKLSIFPSLKLWNPECPNVKNETDRSSLKNFFPSQVFSTHKVIWKLAIKGSSDWYWNLGRKLIKLDHHFLMIVINAKLTWG